jgi:hypothetical protein
MKRKIVTLGLLLAAFLGCGKQQERRHIVILPDVSGSIDRGALEQEFKAIDYMVGSLRRGDRITIIPILSDAEAEASGKILRFEVPENRQAYDGDLRDFRHKLSASLEKMQTGALAQPGSKTDILGSLALAEQEFRTGSGESRRLLIVLSDFIQDDSEVNFRTARGLSALSLTDNFVRQTVKASPLELKGVSIFLGLLQSTEFGSMPRSRRQALRTFWLKYLQSCGANPTFTTDGPGLLRLMSKWK